MPEDDPQINPMRAPIYTNCFSKPTAVRKVHRL